MTKSKDYIEEHHYFMDQLYPPTTVQVDENGNPQSYRNAYIAGQIEALKQVREEIENLNVYAGTYLLHREFKDPINQAQIEALQKVREEMNKLFYKSLKNSVPSFSSGIFTGLSLIDQQIKEIEKK